MKPAPPPTFQRAEVRTTRANDIALALTGIPLGGLELWFASSSVWHLKLSDLGDVGGGWIFVWIKDHLGAPSLAVIVSLFGFYLASLGLGGLWRLVDRRPAIDAHEHGINFHPSVHPTPVSWDKVRSVRMTTASPPEIQIEFQDRFWSLLGWLTARSVKLNVIAIGLSPDAAEKNVQFMRQRLTSSQPM